MKTIAIDFDGVIHSYSKGWQDGSCYDEPMPGAIEGLHKLLDQYTVFILSTRDPRQIVDWMYHWSKALATEIICPDAKFWDKRDVIGVTNRKLPAQAYIDDRAYLFRDWTEVMVLRDEFAHYPKNL